MDFIQILVLALVQGLTEFLPISSSAHLILMPYFMGWDDQGLAFDVAVHVGTLSAVVLYFRQQLISISQDWVESIQKRQNYGDSRLVWAIGIGTIPVGLAGLLFGDLIEEHLRSTLVIALTTILFGILLGWADIKGRRERDEHSLSWRDIIVIGCAQALALIPGTSRSGITITAALMLGLTRAAAARFSFLLSIPAIFLPGALKVIELYNSPDKIEWGSIVLGVILSAVSAYLCIHYFLKLLEKIGMMPFVAYRLVLGVILLAMAL